MKLTQNLRGMSKLMLLLLLIIFFFVGAFLSYVWTMGFYAPNEFNLPSQANLTIENVQFYPEQPSFFNMTVLNPSYSAADAKIEQIIVHTSDGKSYAIDTTSPELSSLSIAPGKFETIKSFWNWANYTDQEVDVYVILASGSGPAVEVKTAFMNLTLTDIVFEPSITSTRFNITVESRGSLVSVDIDKITVNGAEVNNTTPALPYKLDPNATVTFTLHRNWADLQNSAVAIAIKTIQGYVALKTIKAPEVKPVISNVVFYNMTTSFFFNITIQNSAVPPVKLDIDSIGVYVEGQNVTITNGSVSPALPLTLDPSSTRLLTCTWDWSPFAGKNATITVYTAQGFKTSTGTAIPNIP